MNRQIVLVNRPDGEPSEDNFTIVKQPLRQTGEGELLIRLLYLSVDPYLRFFMTEVTPLIPISPLNNVFGGEAVGQVIQSNHESYAVGDIVKGPFGWQEYALSSGDNVQKINSEITPYSTALGLLGTTGLTAYLGLLEVGKPLAGETVVISGAAGAVGTAAGEIAKLHGCRVVGIAGSDRKARYLIDEVGFDSVVNYRAAADFRAGLQEACPDGVDVYFDNVGGTVTDNVVTVLNRYARIAVCGQISRYNGSPDAQGPSFPFEIWKKSALMKGFMMHDYEPKFGEALSRLTQWYLEGKLRSHEHIIEGIENAPRALIGLFKGDNIGKSIVKVAHSY
ncbi:NADP-dependent oxidoreductase [Paenibacillus sp. sptzw28]|uniref:NADP-dependent oxidoreductase n=1 Tax=Paenibacillus sp. sptzw28 TaxID=715179 RepID=UPI001C6E0EAF|nr:NADP-dependent oxidoreductase [Paenibacillus sp. sptzw28]QYR23980.1 NADP-dependent oxidoreductase [Paenibacillus sp. sptzw28]